MQKLHLVNPSHRDICQAEHSYIFHFGAYGWTACRVWADSLEGALDIAADWLREFAPGLIMTRESDALMELYKEARDEIAPGFDLKSDWSENEETFLAIEEKATADLTHTESGYITSHEWSVIEDPSRELIKTQYESIFSGE
jgi:hypothetical protein